MAFLWLWITSGFLAVGMFVHSQEMPSQEMPNQQMKNQGIYNQEMNNQEKNNQEINNQEMKNQEINNQEMPNSTQSNIINEQIEYHMVDLLQDIRSMVSHFEQNLREDKPKVPGKFSVNCNNNHSLDTLREDFKQLEVRLDQRLSLMEIRFELIPNMVITELASKLQCLLHQPECLAHLHCGKHTNGLYGITPPGRPSQSVYCDMTTRGGGWTVIQKRVDNTTDFNRNYNEYQAGFGNPDGNFWIGLDSIHALTDPEGAELYIHLEKHNGDSAYAVYNNFHVGNADEGYRITVSGYSGTAGNSFKKLERSGSRFSAKDKDQDNYHGSCAAAYKSGWWFNNCFEANLNGLYRKGKLNTAWQGIIWYHYTGLGYSLPNVHMMIRTRQIART